MATFDDNIKTIQTAIYGKEMRPAISEALTKSWSAILSMMDSVEQLNTRVNNLPTGGGEDPDKPSYENTCHMASDVLRIISIADRTQYMASDVSLI